MANLEEILPHFREGMKIRRSDWGKFCYIEYKNGEILTAMGNPYRFNKVDIESENWSEYILPEQEEYNWEDVIEGNYLCWFWDTCGDDYRKIASTLVSVDQHAQCKFMSNIGTPWKYCRPVSKDEIRLMRKKK